MRYKPVLLGERNHKPVSPPKQQSSAAHQKPVPTLHTAASVHSKPVPSLPTTAVTKLFNEPNGTTNESMEEYFSDISFSSESEIFSDVSLLDSVPCLEQMISALSSAGDMSTAGIPASLGAIPNSLGAIPASLGAIPSEYRHPDIAKQPLLWSGSVYTASGFDSGDSGISDDSSLGVFDSFNDSTLSVF